MFSKLTINSLKRNKISTVVITILLIFAMTISCSTTAIIINTIYSLSNLKTESKMSDVMQMHTGTISQDELALIDEFTNQHNQIIENQQTIRLINVSGNGIILPSKENLSSSNQDLFFVIQNQYFDFLLDLNNQKIQLNPNEIAVPIHIMLQYNLSIGDQITIKQNDLSKTFTITSYLRDSQMNSPLASSKRFMLHENDYGDLLKTIDSEPEYLIEFALKNPKNAQELQNAYVQSALPKNGPMLTASAFLVLSAVTDIIVILLIILLALFLLLISLLCIRFSFLTTIDDDMKEIGTMKAIGIPYQVIQKLYLNKYRILIAFSGIIGYFFSLLIVNVFFARAQIYLGSNTKNVLYFVFIAFTPIILYFAIMGYCRFLFRKVKRIGAIKALNSSLLENSQVSKRTISLQKNSFLPTNCFIGIQDVWHRFKLYRPLIFIFVFCAFIIIVPLNIANTIQSPLFTTYMGIGKSDIRIDLNSTDKEKYLSQLENQLSLDAQVTEYATYATSMYPVTENKKTDYINIETGDFSLFPLSYTEGRAPVQNNEIALSNTLASQDNLNKKIGDQILIQDAEGEKALKLCGIYQDITNGGKTAKTSAHLKSTEILWRVIYLNVDKATNQKEKIEMLRQKYPDAKINSIHDYTYATLGNIIKQIQTITVISFIMSVGLIILIAALFMNALLAKDTNDLLIMHKLGISKRKIQSRYMVSMSVCAVIGIAIGTLLANLIGSKLFGFGMSMLGASEIHFVYIFWKILLLCPCTLIISALLSTLISCKTRLTTQLQKTGD